MVTCLQLHRANHQPSSWWEGRLRPGDYTEVLRVLDANEIQEDPDTEMAPEWIDNLYYVDTTGDVI